MISKNTVFLDTSSDTFICLIFKNNSVAAAYQFHQPRQHTDKAIKQLSQWLNFHDLKLLDIDECYVCNGPGSYTGTRVSVMIAKTLALLNNKLIIYKISSLRYQIGLSKSCSLLKANLNNWFIAVYDKEQVLLPPQIVDNATAEQLINKFIPFGFQVFKAYHFFDPVANFLALKHLFIKVDDVAMWEPLYLFPAVNKK